MINNKESDIVFRVPDNFVRRFDLAMESTGVDVRERGYYQKWLRYYLDFCQKYKHPSKQSSSLAAFLEKLSSKNQSDVQRRQAEKAVQLFFSVRRQARAEEPNETQVAPANEPAVMEKPVRAYHVPIRNIGSVARSHTVQPSPLEMTIPTSKPGSQVRDATGASWAKELTALRDTIRLRNYSPRTSETYLLWTRKFQAFTHSKPPGTLDLEDVKAFLTDLAVRRNVAASTQNQAFNALLFFYRHVLDKEFGKVEGVVRAKRRRYIPVVLSRVEVDCIVDQLKHPYRLVVLLLYGCGLRISEALELRIQCFNLDEGVLTVHDGKGQKDRTVPLPQVLIPEIKAQFERVNALRQRDQAQGTCGVFLPRQLEKKYPNAGWEFVWQWFFPAKQLSFVKSTGENRRNHLLSSEVQRAVKAAVNAANIPKRVTPHTFRHTFASHLLQANVDIRTIQERLGHSDVRTTMIYTHTVPSRTLKDAGSPLDM